MPMPSMSQRALRRYPALAGFGALAVMALLLPSTLNVPQTGPTTLAELAPVPGKTISNLANLAELAPTSSDGIGAGGSGFTAGAGVASPTTTIAMRATTAGKRRAGTKRCVGNPPRQTEDPLSPPCIAFFDGDNGGATAKGVTRDEIRVVFLPSCGSNTPQRTDDYDKVSHVYGALLKYFSERFQTYGRRVHGWAYQGNCVTQDAERAVVRDLNEQLDPFAIVNISATAVMADEAARLGIWTNIDEGRREEMARRAPFLASFSPDEEDRLSSTAALLCAKLAGRPARYSGDPTLRAAARKFALHYSRGQQATRAGQGVLLDDIRQRCGGLAGDVLLPSSDNNYALDIPRWRAAGITTVVDVGDSITYALAAQQEGWLPEWFRVPDLFSPAADRAYFPASQLANSYAITPMRRLASRPEDQDSYQATKAACPDCVNPSSQLDYDNFLLLFWGIQAAGPKLSVENVDKGLRGIPPRASPNPWTPAAYFAPDNWSFVKDSMLVRWDKGAVGTYGPGCWRTVEYGKRYRAEDWASSPGDDNFDRFDEWPCDGE
jgi:hypothetical protein